MRFTLSRAVEREARDENFPADSEFTSLSVGRREKRRVDSPHFCASRSFVRETRRDVREMFVISYVRSQLFDKWRFTKAYLSPHNGLPSLLSIRVRTRRREAHNRRRDSRAVCFSQAVARSIGPV